MTRNSQNEAGFPLAPAGSSDASVVTGPLPGVVMLNVSNPLEVLPPEAREKVADLKRRREEFSVLYLADFENEQALRAEIFRHEARIADLTKPRGSGGYDLDGDDIRVVSEQKRLDQKRGDLARLLAAKDARGTESQRLGELLRNIEQALAGRPSGCVAKMVVVDPPIVKGDIAATVEGRRRRGRELLADLEKVRAAPFPSTLAKKKMRATCICKPTIWSRKRLAVSQRLTNKGCVPSTSRIATAPLRKWSQRRSSRSHKARDPAEIAALAIKELEMR